MNPSQRPDFAEAADYTGVLRRRWWIVLALACLGVVGALGYTLVAAKTYAATASVFVQPDGADQANPITGGRTSGAVDLDTEAQHVTSGQVLAPAARMMKSPLTVYQLRKDIKISVPPNTQFLDITCTAPTGAAAATCANDVAASYLAQRRAAAAATLAGSIKTMRADVASLQNTVASLSAAAASLPSNSKTRLADLGTVANDKVLINSLNGKLSDLISDSANDTGGSLATAATAPGHPASPSKTIDLPSGLVAGLILGLIGAFVWDRRDKRLHNPQDVERLLDLPVLLSLPRNASGRQVSLASPRSRAGRAFTELAHTVAASLGEGNHILLVTGATPGPETSLVAANLAVALARTRPEAVLICADLRDSLAPELFGLPGRRGLAEVLAGRATVTEVARGPAGAPGLWVIPPGADTTLAEYHIQYDTAKALTSQLRRDARYVIIEAPGSDAGTDAFALAEFADAALLTVQANHTSQPQASTCLRRLHQMRIPVLGAAVLSPLRARPAARPPQPPTQPRLHAGQANGRSEPLTRPGPGELSGTPGGAASWPDHPVRARDGQGNPADTITGR